MNPDDPAAGRADEPPAMPGDMPKEFTAVPPGSESFEKLHRRFHGENGKFPRAPFSAATFALEEKMSSGCLALAGLLLVAYSAFSLWSGEVYGKRGGPPFRYRFGDLIDGPEIGWTWFFFLATVLLMAAGLCTLVLGLFSRKWLVFEPATLGLYHQCLWHRRYESVERLSVKGADRYFTRNHKNRIRWQVRIVRADASPLELAYDIKKDAAIWLAVAVARWAGVDYRDVSRDGQHEGLPEGEVDDADAAPAPEPEWARPVAERPALLEPMPPGEAVRALLAEEVRPGGDNVEPHADTRGYRIRLFGTGTFITVFVIGVLFLALAWWSVPVWPWTTWELIRGLAGTFILGTFGALGLFEVFFQEPFDWERQWLFFSPDRVYWVKRNYNRWRRETLPRGDLTAVELLEGRRLGVPRWNLRFHRTGGGATDWPLFLTCPRDARWLADQASAWAGVPLRLPPRAP